jgi:ABC-type oligopeptide transport system substrate-binding subunit
MKTKTGMLLWLLALSILTAGCDSGREPGATSTASSVIYRGNGGDPGSLDPALAEDIHAFNILTDLYEGLVAESATGELVPGVAESWTISADGLTYTFTLRDDARWSNGEAVTSADFVRAFRRVADPATASVYGFLLEPIQAVLASDEKILQLTLVGPTPHILSLLSMPIAFPTPASIAAASDVEAFVGNGAYRLAEHIVGGPTRLQRSPSYWDASSVAVDEIVYLPIVDPATEFNMYRAGEIDITNTVPPPGTYRSFACALLPCIRLDRTATRQRPFAAGAEHGHRSATTRIADRSRRASGIRHRPARRCGACRCSISMARSFG